MKKFIITYKMGKEIITFGDIEVEKHKSHQRQNPVSICDININRKVVSNKVPLGKKDFKYIIGYKYDNTIRPLYVMLPKLVHIEETLMKLNACLFC